MPLQRKGLWRIIAILLAGMLVMAACGDDDDEEGGGGGQEDGEARTVTIGFVGAKTGDNANLGINIRDGVRVAIEEENEKDDNVTIELKEFDTAGDPAQATTVAPQFLGDESIVATVGPAFSGETRALIPLYHDAELAFISSSATNVQLPTVVPNTKVFHRVIANDALQAAGIAAYFEKAKPASVAYVHDNSEYGKALTEDTEKLTKAKGVRTAVIATVDPKAQDFSATVNRVRSSGAAAVFYGGYYAEAGRFRKQLVDSGVRAEFVSGDGSLDPGFITAAGPGPAEGAKLSCPCNLAFETSTGKLKEFYDNFKRRIGKDPGLYSPEAYDAAKILIKGIKEGHDTRAEMLDWLETDVGTYEGVSKTIEFEEDGDIKSTQFFVFQVKGGKIAPSEEIQAEKPAEQPAGTTTTTSR